MAEFVRRTHYHGKPDKPLSGFALDITIRVNERGQIFLVGNRGLAVHCYDEQVMADILRQEVAAHKRGHFGKEQT